jgi:hypothetical protein
MTLSPQADHLQIAAAMIERIDADAEGDTSHGNEPGTSDLERAQLHLMLSIAQSLHSLDQHGIQVHPSVAE